MRKINFALAMFISISAQAQTDTDSDAGPKPSPVTSQATWLFSWTKDPHAATDPAGHAARIFRSAQDCEGKIAAAADHTVDIPNCQGNGMAAGPGLYLADNPFTSHDYGSTAVFARSKAGDPNIVDVSDSMRPADVIDPQLVTNKSIEAIMYAFRGAETGGSAIVLRDGALFATAAESIAMPSAPKEFNDHLAFACTDATDFRDILRHWGDQIDFLAIVFDTFRDPTTNKFRNGASMNQSAWLAALAANIVAAPDSQVKAKIARLSGVAPEIKDGLTDDNCANNQHVSPRSCLANELYVSLVGDRGTDNFPTGAWTFPALKKALVSLAILTPAEAAANRTLPVLQDFLTKRFQTASAQAQRAREAFRCAEVARKQFTASPLASWTAVK